jgi:hypothetical protein
MPVKLRPGGPKARAAGKKITPEAVQLYARACAILQAGADGVSEAEGGQEEFSNLDMALRRLFDRRPWECGLFEVDVDEVEPDEREEHDCDGARAIRIALEAALEEADGGTAAD